MSVRRSARTSVIAVVGLAVTAWAVPADSLAQSLVSAVLPSSRSVQVGDTATAFATIINLGPGTATACGIALLTGLPAGFLFQTTDPATNALSGTPDTPVDLAAGAAQSFVFAITPTAPFSPTDVQFLFDCTNTSPANNVPGLNTLVLSASNTPTPDIVALVATLSNDGIVEISGTGVFAVATVNVGASATIIVSANTGNAVLPVSISVCETNPISGACLASPVSAAGSLTTQIDSGETPTFGFFVDASGNVPFDPAANRIFVRFKDQGGAVRGATSVAVMTVDPDPQPGFAFCGTYVGTFAGDDSGSFTAVVDENGNVSGSGISVSVGSFTIAGSVSSTGDFVFVAGSVSTGATFIGVVTPQGAVSGTWANAFGESGTFSGSRQVGC